MATKCDYIQRNGEKCGVRAAPGSTRCGAHTGKTSHSACVCGKWTSLAGGACSKCALIADRARREAETLQAALAKLGLAGAAVAAPAAAVVAAPAPAAAPRPPAVARPDNISTTESDIAEIRCQQVDVDDPDSPTLDDIRAATAAGKEVLVHNPATGKYVKAAGQVGQKLIADWVLTGGYAL